MVLLILAGITITYVFGDNGIIKLAQEAKNKTEEAMKNEQNDMKGLLEELKTEHISDIESSGFVIKVVDTEGNVIRSDAKIELYDRNSEYIKEIEIPKNGIYDASLEKLELGTYYVRCIVAPEGYQLDNSIQSCKLLNINKNIWNLRFRKLVSLPSSGSGTGLEDVFSPDINLNGIYFDKQVNIKVNDEYDETLKGDTMVNIFEVATFNISTKEYEYVDNFKNLGLPSITYDGWRNESLANQLDTIIKQSGNITPEAIGELR